MKDNSKPNRKSVQIAEDEHLIEFTTPDTETKPSPTNPYSMTEANLRKRSYRIPCGRLSTQVYACAVACVGSISFGSVLAWSTNPLHVFDYSVFTGNQTWITSMVPLGSSLGVLVWSITMSKLGPKRTLQLQAPFFVIIWIVTALEINSSPMVTRFFLGAFGVAYVICGNRLLNESVSTILLRFMDSISLSAVYFGMFMTDMLNGYQVNRDRIIHLACVCVPPILHFLMLLIMPDSPAYLYRTKGETYCEKALMWYQGKSNVQITMRMIKKRNEYNSLDYGDIVYFLYAKAVMKANLIILGITFFDVFSGYYLLMFYGTHILGEKSLVTNHTFDSMIIGILIYVSRVFWLCMHLIYKMSVRRCLMASCIIVSLSQSLLGTCLFLKDVAEQDKQIKWVIFRWSELAFAALLIFGNDLGLSYFRSFILKEYLPIQVQNYIQSLSYSVFWLFVFFTVKYYGTWCFYLPDYLLCLIASGILFLGSIFMYMLAVEIKGRSLIQIQNEIGGNPIGTRVEATIRSGPTIKAQENRSSDENVTQNKS